MNESADSDLAIMPGRDLKSMMRSASSSGGKVVEALAEGMSEEGREEVGAEEDESEL